MKTKFLKHCSIKNLLIVLSLLILLYLIYDTYVVRENFADNGFTSQFDTLFGVERLEDVKTNFDVSLGKYCEKIKTLNALCTKCDTKADELLISKDNGAYIIDEDYYKNTLGGEDLRLEPYNFNVPTQALVCAEGYAKFDTHDKPTKSTIDGEVMINDSKNGWIFKKEPNVRCKKLCNHIDPMKNLTWKNTDYMLSKLSYDLNEKEKIKDNLKCKDNYIENPDIDSNWYHTYITGCKDGTLQLSNSPCIMDIKYIVSLFDGNKITTNEGVELGSEFKDKLIVINKKYFQDDNIKEITLYEDQLYIDLGGAVPRYFHYFRLKYDDLMDDYTFSEYKIKDTNNNYNNYNGTDFDKESLLKLIKKGMDDDKTLQDKTYGTKVKRYIMKEHDKKYYIYSNHNHQGKKNVPLREDGTWYIKITYSDDRPEYFKYIFTIG